MQIISTDVLILGGGLTAYMAAYTLLKKERKGNLVIVSPGKRGKRFSGMNAPLLSGDSAAQFEQDTLAAGCRQNDPALVKLLCGKSETVYDRVWAMAGLGRPEAGSRFAPAEGEGLLQSLMEAVRRPSVKIMEKCHGLRLLILDGRVQGALCYDEGNRAFFAVSAGTVLLATGGYGDLYRRAYPGGGGNGIGMAYFAGAEMADLEFEWFPPEEKRGEQNVVTLGGVVIDSQCRTSIPGLLAAGAVTAGVHGAGYLPGNGETAALVFGRQAGHTLNRMEYLPGAKEDALYDWVAELVFIGQKDQTAAFARIRSEIETVLEKGAGPVRTQQQIEDALQITAHLQHELNELELCPLHQVWERMELEHAITAARLTLLASLEREECCGCYQRAAIRKTEAASPAEAGDAPVESPAPADGEQTELIIRDRAPYRVTMKLTNMLLLPEKTPWNP